MARLPVTVTAARTDITMPAPEQRVNARGVKSQYNLAGLAVGASIGVIGRNAKQLTTTIATANKADYPAIDTKGKPIMEVVKDADGKPIMTPEGKPSEKAKTVKRVYFAVDCNPETDPDKATARIWRES